MEQCTDESSTVTTPSGMTYKVVSVSITRETVFDPDSFHAGQTDLI
ncbi:MAG: hypothetical protein IPM83_16335 [Ignavibacteria bacterium]|nr:hypothetical protein [Ignavibacteria bacterium]